MRLFIAEKPSLGQAIAEQLPGTPKRSKTHIDLGDDVVTWCFGHILEQAMPEAYSQSWAIWDASQLPMVPAKWKLVPKEDSKQQLAAIKGLLTKATTVINAGDADREGQLLVDEVLEFLDNRKPVGRILVTDYSAAKVRAAIDAISDNSAPQFVGWTQSALARSRFDWLYGLNLTRAYTLAARRKGFPGLLTVGRVQTPTLGLVVARDLAIETFAPLPFFGIAASIGLGQQRSAAKWMPEDDQEGLDEEGRLTDATIADELIDRLSGKAGVVTEFERIPKSHPPPLLFSLSALIKATNAEWGHSAQQILDASQALYEIHKLTTYPRTDCRYVSKDRVAEAPLVLEAIRANLPNLVSHAPTMAAVTKSKAFDDSKVSAHHAILPTAKQADLASLSAIERHVYELVARSYVAQFCSWRETLQTTASFSIESARFRIAGTQETAAGWRSVFDPDDVETDLEDMEETPPMTVGQLLQDITLARVDRRTSPPARFTEGTLSDAMLDVHRFVSNPEIKKRLRAGQGIGTEATRPGIIEELKRRGFLALEKAGSKKIVSTEIGRLLINALPPNARDPGLTAICEQALEQVAAGSMTSAQYVEQHLLLIRRLVSDAAVADLQVPEAPRCSVCATGFLMRHQGKRGPFWSCSNRSTKEGATGCAATFMDVAGQPGLPEAPRGAISASAMSDALRQHRAPSKKLAANAKSKVTD